MTERRWRIPRGDFAEVARSRAEFSDFLRIHTEPESRLNSAELIYGEVVANAVRHAVSVATVTLLLDRAVRLLVADDGASGRLPTAEAASYNAETGRGLYIVSELARELHFQRLAPGLLVTVVLPVFERLSLS